MTDIESEDISILSSILEAMKADTPWVEIELEESESDSYFPGKNHLNLSQWTRDHCGYAEVSIYRKLQGFDSERNGIYKDVEGIEVKFIEGESSEPEYLEDPVKMREEWLKTYKVEFLRIYQDICKKYKLFFEISEP